MLKLCPFADSGLNLILGQDLEKNVNLYNRNDTRNLIILRLCPFADSGLDPGFGQDLEKQ